VPAAASRRNSRLPSGSDIAVNGRRVPLPAALVRRVVETVLRGERRRALISITFLGRDAMRRLNAEHKGHDRATDVLSFAMTDAAGGTIGDVYVCPWVAAREARSRGIPERQELIRLVVHGTLHALGRDHPEDERRTSSAMWRRQERYVEALV
jgi:probable rRNA maturation factor